MDIERDQLWNIKWKGIQAKWNPGLRLSNKHEPQCQMENIVLNIFRKQYNIRWPVALLLIFLDLMPKSILFLSEKWILQESLDLTNWKSDKVALISVLF